MNSYKDVEKCLNGSHSLGSPVQAFSDNVLPVSLSVKRLKKFASPTR